jgi:hypothetical protein
MKINEIEKKQPFAAPQGYLENFRLRPKVKAKRRLSKLMYAAAAACAVWVLSVWFWPQNPENDKLEVELEALPGSLYSFEVAEINLSLDLIEELEQLDLLPETDYFFD